MDGAYSFLTLLLTWSAFAGTVVPLVVRLRGIVQGEGDFGSGAWRSQAQAWRLEWETDNPHYVMDIDTPEDLARWQGASQDS